MKIYEKALLTLQWREGRLGEPSFSFFHLYTYFVIDQAYGRSKIVFDLPFHSYYSKIILIKQNIWDHRG